MIQELQNVAFSQLLQPLTQGRQSPVVGSMNLPVGQEQMLLARVKLVAQVVHTSALVHVVQFMGHCLQYLMGVEMKWYPFLQLQTPLAAGVAEMTQLVQVVALVHLAHPLEQAVQIPLSS